MSCEHFFMYLHLTGYRGSLFAGRHGSIGEAAGGRMEVSHTAFNFCGFPGLPPSLSCLGCLTAFQEGGQEEA
ncbi:Uncharacterized protein HZ326_24404 [Fusarium oxysporum f. sp. albedinis]|nr:Uncharacterized protein HZ326_28314 [Fusarium oxysporum f. sp. albedinis]KAJ0132513.1 Uncharacterized protein HZ326_24404 [Fusarium oxysporum f. sp. albedinis]